MSTKKLQIVGGIVPKSDWEQSDSTQADYIKNKPIKTTVLSADSTDEQYPTAKAVVGALSTIQTKVKECESKILCTKEMNNDNVTYQCARLNSSLNGFKSDNTRYSVLIKVTKGKWYYITTTGLSNRFSVYGRNLDVSTNPYVSINISNTDDIEVVKLSEDTIICHNKNYDRLFIMLYDNGSVNLTDDQKSEIEQLHIYYADNQPDLCRDIVDDIYSPESNNPLSGKALAAALSDQQSYLESRMRYLYLDDFVFTQDDFELGIINVYTGVFMSSSTKIRTKNIFKFPCDVIVAVKNGYKYTYHIYLNGVWQKAATKSSFLTSARIIPANTEVRFVLGHSIDTDISCEESNNLLIQVPYQSPIRSWGESNAFATLNQLQNISYELLADVKGVGTPTLYAQKYTGILYSQTRQPGKLVGTDVLLDTFVTAVHNPRSVIYTKELSENLSGCYYGMGCINLVLAVWGFPFYINCVTFSQDMPDIEKVEFQDIKPLDAIVSADLSVWHAKLIKDVTYDKYGRVINVTTIESQGIKVTEGTEVTPLLTEGTVAFDKFVTQCKASHYELYRYSKLSNAVYTPSKYIGYYYDDVVDNTYSDIVTEYGDKCALPVGTKLTINVLNTDGYTSIAGYSVAEDGTETSTDILTSTIADFEIPENLLTYGKYRIKMSGDGKETCQTDFILVDVNASISSNILSFSSANANCICVKGLDSDYIVRKTLVPTEADLSSGTIDITSIQETPNVSYIRVGFRCEYGNVYKDLVKH